MIDATDEFTLWYRSGRGYQWRKIADAPTELELAGLLKGLPSGEVIPLPAGRHPDEQSRAK